MKPTISALIFASLIGTNLHAEEKVDRAAKLKIRSQKREIAEGTEEWDLLHRRYYAEELKKLGVDITR